MRTKIELYIIAAWNGMSLDEPGTGDKLEDWSLCVDSERCSRPGMYHENGTN